MKEFETVLAEQEAAREKRERLHLAERVRTGGIVRAAREAEAGKLRAIIGVVLAVVWIVVGGLLVNRGAAEKIEQAEARAAAAEERAASAEERAMAAEERAAGFIAEADSLRAELWRLDDLMEQGNEDGAEDVETTDPADKPAWEYAGEFRIYHYCPCAKYCGKTDGITRTGTKATAGRTVSVDPSVIPLGSEVRIGDNIYIAEDTGVIGRCIDIFVDDHEEALRLGTYTAGVWWR